MAILDETLKCAFCFNVCVRPVTASAHPLRWHDRSAPVRSPFELFFCGKLRRDRTQAPCQHNFCLACFTKWTVQQSKNTCPKCRTTIPAAMRANPRINSKLVAAIRMARSHAPCPVSRMPPPADRIGEPGSRCRPRTVAPRQTLRLLPRSWPTMPGRMPASARIAR